MQPEQIMSSDLLDILFADRNKMYGAYPLRRGYNKRLSIALLTTGGIVALSLMFYYTSGKTSVFAEKIKVNDSVRLVEIIPDEPAPPIPPPPPPPPPEQQVLTRSFTNPPQIVAEPDEKDKPPTVDELDIARVALFNQDGIPTDIVAPQVSDNTGVIAAPVRTNEDSIFTSVEIESSYPGGLGAWKRFLIKTTKYPSDAEENRISGTVIVKFIVDKEGNVSQVEAVSGPEELRKEAVRVIGKSGKWSPAIQNGRIVNSFKQQPITFQLSE